MVLQAAATCRIDLHCVLLSVCTRVCSCMCSVSTTALTDAMASTVREALKYRLVTEVEVSQSNRHRAQRGAYCTEMPTQRLLTDLDLVL